MSDETESLTLRLLQEMRQMRSEVGEAREEARETAKDLTNRINGLTVLLRMLAGMVHDHEERLVKVESR